LNKEYLTLISRVEDELSEIKNIIDRSQKAWKNAQNKNDDLYIDSVALNLHSFYVSLERIFQLIADEIDGSLPSGNAWHQNLLKQMKTEIKKIRPRVISNNSYKKLDEYRGFRHIVRNVYSFQLASERIKPLVQNLPELFNQIEHEIRNFLDDLSKIN